MSGPQVVGIGLSVLDVLVRLKEMPSWDHQTFMSGFALDGGGLVVNAIVAASRMGMRAAYVGTAGSDAAADLKLRGLSRDGVDLSHLVIRPGPENQVTLVFVDEESGERSFCSSKDTAANQLRPEELDRAFITSAQYLHVDGYHFHAALQAARWMHEEGKTVVMDGTRISGGCRPPLTELSKEGAGRWASPAHYVGLPVIADLIEQIDVLIGGSGFVPALTGEDDLWVAGRRALEMGPRIVVQTEGADGSYTVTAEDEFHTPAFDVEVVDTTGAGDTFHGAYIVGLHHGWDLRHTATFATAASAIVCTRRGAQSGIPTFDEVAGFLRERGIWWGK